MKKIASNMLHVNCYFRDNYPLFDRKSEYPKRRYESIEEVSEILEDGTPVTKHVYSEHDYEITPDYIDSQVAVSDYRNDVIGSVASSTPCGKNLGDVSAIQAISGLDDAEARMLYQELQAKFGSSMQKIVKSEKVDGKVEDGGNVDNER